MREVEVGCGGTSPRLRCVKLNASGRYNALGGAWLSVCPTLLPVRDLQQR